MYSEKTFVLLEKIIEKGGLLGKIGRIYKDDLKKADQFLKECAAQCHVPGAIEYWGLDLTNELMRYSERKFKN